MEAEDHKNRILEELKELLRAGYCDDSIDSVVEIDTHTQTIIIKFNYSIVPEDDYVGLAMY